MFDIMAAITGAVTLAKELTSLMSTVKDAKAKELAMKLEEKLSELRLEIANTKGYLADSRTKVAELTEENLRLKDELKKSAAPPEIMTKDGMYYKATGEGPYCTTCHDTERALILLTKNYGSDGLYRCNKCGAKFGNAVLGHVK